MGAETSPARPPSPRAQKFARQAVRPSRARRDLEWVEAQSDARAHSSSLDPLPLFRGIVTVSDAAVILLAAALAFVFRYGLVTPPLQVVVAPLLALVIMYYRARRADRDQTEVAGSLSTQLASVTRRWVSTVVLLLVAAYLLRLSTSYARLWAAAWFVLGLAGFAFVRLAVAQRLRSWRRCGRLARIVAIVDLDGAGTVMARRLQSESAEEIRLLGVFAADQAAGEAGAVRRRSTLGDLIGLSRLFRIDDVLVTVSGSGGEALQNTLLRLSTLPTTVRLCPVIPPARPAPVCLPELLFGHLTLVLSRKPLPGWHVVTKRCEDLLLGTAMLAALSPLMLLVAVAIRLDSPGPVLFRQKRLGFNNNPITVFKFRSMTHRASDVEAEIRQATRRDPRVTWVGRIIRRSSLDELPQLFNVLRGEMSLVGPRPHAVVHNAKYAALIDNYLGRHRMPPGITGWAQVNGWRGETDTLDKMQKRVEFDLAYIENWSILFDLRILAQTALGILFHRQAF